MLIILPIVLVYKQPVPVEPSKRLEKIFNETNMKISRQSLIKLALSGVLLLVIVLIVWQLSLRDTNINNQKSPSADNSQPILMSANEKKELGIPDNLSVEIINRNQEGQITTYKLIKDN